MRCVRVVMMNVMNVMAVTKIDDQIDDMIARVTPTRSAIDKRALRIAPCDKYVLYE